jgi:hypothetical protein
MGTAVPPRLDMGTATATATATGHLGAAGDSNKVERHAPPGQTRQNTIRLVVLLWLRREILLVRFTRRGRFPMQRLSDGKYAYATEWGKWCYKAISCLVTHFQG